MAKIKSTSKKVTTIKFTAEFEIEVAGEHPGLTPNTALMTMTGHRLCRKKTEIKDIKYGPANVSVNTVSCGIRHDIRIENRLNKILENTKFIRGFDGSFYYNDTFQLPQGDAATFISRGHISNPGNAPIMMFYLRMNSHTKQEMRWIPNSYSMKQVVNFVNHTPTQKYLESVDDNTWRTGINIVAWEIDTATRTSTVSFTKEAIEFLKFINIPVPQITQISLSAYDGKQFPLEVLMMLQDLDALFGGHKVGEWSPINLVRY